MKPENVKRINGLLNVLEIKAKQINPQPTMIDENDFSKEEIVPIPYHEFVSRVVREIKTQLESA